MARLEMVGSGFVEVVCDELRSRDSKSRGGNRLEISNFDDFLVETAASVGSLPSVQAVKKKFPNVLEDMRFGRVGFDRTLNIRFKDGLLLTLTRSTYDYKSKQ